MRRFLAHIAVALVLCTSVDAQPRWFGEGRPESVVRAMAPARVIVVVPADSLERLTRARLARFGPRVSVRAMPLDQIAQFVPGVVSGSAVVCDAAGVLLARDDGEAVEHVVADVLAGRLDAARARALRELDATCEPEAVEGKLERAIELRDADPLQLEPWRTIVVGRGDVDRSALRSAIEALGDRAEYVARILVLAIESDPTVLRLPVVDRWVRRWSVSRSRSRTACTLAFEHAVSVGGASAPATRAFRWIEAARGDVPELVRIVERLASHDVRATCVEPRRTALDLALRLAPDHARLLHAKFELVTRDSVDWIEAERVGRDLVGWMGQDANALNSFAWRCLTEAPFAGNLKPLALHACRTMQSITGWERFWRLDTVALAEFENGNFAAAVELQRAAIESCGDACRSRYAARLETYEQAAAASSIQID